MGQTPEVSITGLLRDLRISSEPDSPKPVRKSKKKTATYLKNPQMDREYFGVFKCGCKNQWRSAHAWFRYEQACHECSDWMHPSQLYEKKKCSKRGKTPHDQTACRKCEEVGNCVTWKRQI
jgi:hypothetical protein